MTDFQELALIGAIWIIFGLTHSVLASMKLKSRLIDRGLIREHIYRMLYNALSALFMISLVWLHLQSKQEELYDLPWFLQIPAWVLLFTGVWILYRSFEGYDLREFIGLRAIQNNSGRLHTGGLNAEVRHPLYLGSMVLFVSLFILFPRVDVIFSGFLAILYLFIGTHFEERKLYANFPEEYGRYVAQVPRFLPKNPLRFIRLLAQKSESDS